MAQILVPTTQNGHSPSHHRCLSFSEGISRHSHARSGHLEPGPELNGFVVVSSGKIRPATCPVFGRVGSIVPVASRKKIGSPAGGGLWPSFVETNYRFSPQCKFTGKSSSRSQVPAPATVPPARLAQGARSWHLAPQSPHRERGPEPVFSSVPRRRRGGRGRGSSLPRPRAGREVRGC